MKRKKRIIIATLVFAVLYTILWFVLAGIAEGKIIAQLEAQQAGGITITTGIHSKSGFPFALRVRLRDFNAQSQSGMQLSAPVVVIGARLTDWSHLTIAAPEPADFTIPAGKARGTVKATIATLKGDFLLTGKGVGSASLVLHNLSAAGFIETGTITVGDLSLHLDLPETPPVDHTQPGSHLIMNATNIGVPPPAIAGLGNRINRLTLEAVVMGKLPALDQSALQAWSEDGGTLEIHELSTEWGPMSLGLGGTLALDNDLQPLGSFNAKATGFKETLDALSQAHAIKPSSAGMLAIGLGLLAKPEGADNVPTLAVPITIQNREAYVASFKLAAVPPIRLY